MPAGICSVHAIEQHKGQHFIVMELLGGETLAERLGLRQREILVLETHLNSVPEDARAHILLVTDYAAVGRHEEALRDANLAIALRPNDGSCSTTPPACSA